MKKNGRLALVALLALLVLLLTSCGGETTEEVGDWSYVFNKTEEYARIVRYNGEAAEVVIPDTLGGKPVQEIGTYAFLDAPHVTSITIPACVKKIEDSSFYSLPALAKITVAEENISFAAVEDVLYHKKMGTIYCYPQGKTGDTFTLPDTVKTINGKAFYNSQLKEIVMTDKVTKVLASAFAESKNLEKVVFSNKLSQIYEEAFMNCSSLKELNFPANLTSIGANCFNGCTSLTAVVVPNKVGTLDAGAFANCTSLKSIDIQGKGIQRLAADTFSGDVALETVTTAADLMGIADGVFRNCTSLKTLAVTEKLVTIGTEAFAGCTAFADFTLPQAVTSVGARAFEGTAYLAAKTDDFVIDGNGILLAYNGADTNVTIPAGVTAVSYLNKNVTSVTVPEGVTALCDAAFKDCTALTKIELPATVKTFGVSTFENCSGFTTFTVPAGLERMGEHCFAGCTSMEAYAVDPANTCFYIDQGVLYDKIRTTLIWYPVNSSMTTYVFPYGQGTSGTTALGIGAFRGAKNLESVDTSVCEALLKYADYAFADCPKLKSVKTHGDFTVLGEGVFENCTSLSDFEIKYTMNNIGARAFYNCTSLANLQLQDPIAKIGQDAFVGVTGTFKVSGGSVAEEYCKARNLPYTK